MRNDGRRRAMTGWGMIAITAAFVPCAASAQSPASVLAASDIWSEHPFQRPIEVEGREWLALRVTDGQSRLERVALRWRATDLFGDSVFALEVTPPEPVPLLLVTGVPALRPGPATTSLEYEESLSREVRTLEIALGGATYTLSLSSEDPMLCDATITLSDGEVTQTLYPPGNDDFSCDEPHFSVQWAGDVDGDGRLDLVTTLSPKYSWYPRRLYLSSAAAPGELVGLVAVLELAAA